MSLAITRLGLIRVGLSDHMREVLFGSLRGGNTNVFWAGYDATLLTQPNEMGATCIMTDNGEGAMLERYGFLAVIAAIAITTVALVFRFIRRPRILRSDSHSPDRTMDDHGRLQVDPATIGDEK